MDSFFDPAEVDALTRSMLDALEGHSVGVARAVLGSFYVWASIQGHVELEEALAMIRSDWLARGSTDSPLESQEVAEA